MSNMNVLELVSLKGKIVLVTGGAGNYGRSITEGLAEAGATVVIASRDVSALEKVASDFRERKLDVVAMQLDQGEIESVVRLKEGIVARFGRLDVFVNNAVS